MNKKEFRAYLQAHQEQEFTRCNPWCCPLASHLSDTYDGVSVTGSVYEYRTRRNHRYYARTLPAWAQKFVAGVDKDNKKSPITGAEALEVLG